MFTASKNFELPAENPFLCSENVCGISFFVIKISVVNQKTRASHTGANAWLFTKCPSLCITTTTTQKTAKQ